MFTWMYSPHQPPPDLIKESNKIQNLNKILIKYSLIQYTTDPIFFQILSAVSMLLFAIYLTVYISSTNICRCTSLLAKL